MSMFDAYRRPAIADLRLWLHSAPMKSTLSKPERMELRRATGTRALPVPLRREKGPDYLVAHACFDCRKSWKVQMDTDAVCPQCGAPLHDMGRTFRAPKKSDAEQWEKVRALWSAGFRFWSYRSHPDAEPLPERLRDVEDFVRRNPHHPCRHVR
jgi:hypothetical protein